MKFTSIARILTVCVMALYAPRISLGQGKWSILPYTMPINPIHATLLRNVWGPGYETETEYTRVYVRRLRAKLEDPDGPALIVTEPRAGYRMELPAD